MGWGLDGELQPLPAQYLCWADLLYNQVPGCSFPGHLCGILAGLVHVFLHKSGKSQVLQLCIWISAHTYVHQRHF